MTRNKSLKMTLEQQAFARKLAIRCTWPVLRGDMPYQSGEWWAGECSYELGIVDGYGCIDYTSEVARFFIDEYNVRMNTKRGRARAEQGL